MVNRSMYNALFRACTGPLICCNPQKDIAAL
uniref:Uncharacterized protein n=1 Tax=Arundo donax TaxID=35708 RepID=A0A0A9EUN1_ARUDO